MISARFASLLLLGVSSFIFALYFFQRATEKIELFSASYENDDCSEKLLFSYFPLSLFVEYTEKSICNTCLMMSLTKAALYCFVSLKMTTISKDKIFCCILMLKTISTMVKDLQSWNCEKAFNTLF